MGRLSCRAHHAQCDYEIISNASFGIYFPKFINCLRVAVNPVNFLEIVLGYVGAAATKALFIGVVILATAHLF